MKNTTTGRMMQDRNAALRVLYSMLAEVLIGRMDQEARRAEVEAARAEWAELRAQLSRQIVGQPDLVTRLSLILFSFRCGLGPHRLLLVGRSGAGKTYIARCVAEVAGVPFYRVDVQQVSESGFRGITIESVLQGMYRAAGRSLVAMERMVVVLDELDKRRIPESDSNVPEKRRADQASLLALLDGDGTPLAFNGRGEDGDTQVSTRGMLIIACGAFTDAPWSGRVPTQAELVRYGLLEELVTRITEVVHIPDHTMEGLAEMFSDRAGGAAAEESVLFEELGFNLEIDPAVYRYVARALVRAGISGASRVGRACIVAAGRAVLARALLEGRPIGTTLRITPDDVTLPGTSSEPLDHGGHEPPGPWLRAN